MNKINSLKKKLYIDLSIEVLKKWIYFLGKFVKKYIDTFNYDDW